MHKHPSVFLTLSMMCIAWWSVSIVYSQTPRIKWAFDTRDASFGQTAAGDIDRDGKLELVFGCYRNDSCIYALNAEDGSLLWKYNARTSGAEGCNDVAPIIYDVDGDGNLEVIVPSSCNPTTFCFDGKTGAVKWKTPTRGSDSPPTIADVDGDGKAEVLHGEFGGYVICINAESGTVAWELAVDTHSWIQTAPTLVDLDGNGALDFVVATWNRTTGDTNKVYAFRCSDRKLLWSYPLTNVVYHGTAVADLDRDGKPELVIGDYSAQLTVLNGEDGSVAWRYKWATSYYIGSPATIADLDGDGRCEVVITAWFKVIALTSDGKVRWDYSIEGYPSAFRGAALSDVDGDAKPDVIFGTSNGKVIALKGTSGAQLWSIDLAAHYGNAAFELDHAPIIADFDRDDTLDLFIVGGHAEYPEFNKDFGRAYALSIGKGLGPDWLMFQNNIRRTSSLCAMMPNDTKRLPEARSFSLDVFPNPANDRLIVGINEPAAIEIIDRLGRIVQRLGVTEESSITVSHLPAGIYLLKAATRDRVAVRKFVKR